MSSMHPVSPTNWIYLGSSFTAKLCDSSRHSCSAPEVVESTILRRVSAAITVVSEEVGFGSNYRVGVESRDGKVVGRGVFSPTINCLDLDPGAGARAQQLADLQTDRIYPLARQ